MLHSILTPKSIQTAIQTGRSQQHFAKRYWNPPWWLYGMVLHPRHLDAAHDVMLQIRGGGLLHPPPYQRTPCNRQEIQGEGNTRQWGRFVNQELREKTWVFEWYLLQNVWSCWIASLKSWKHVKFQNAKYEHVPTITPPIVGSVGIWPANHDVPIKCLISAQTSRCVDTTVKGSWLTNRSRRARSYTRKRGPVNPAPHLGWWKHKLELKHRI